MQINDLQEVTDAPQAMVQGCKNGRQALALCVRLSGLTDEEVANRVGISKGYLSKILSGRASLDADRRIKLMRVCGNRAPLQYEAWAMGISTMARDPNELLREAMAMLERSRA